MVRGIELNNIDKTEDVEKIHNADKAKKRLGGMKLGGVPQMIRMERTYPLSF